MAAEGGPLVDTTASAFYYGVHIGASSSWDDQAAARLCELVIASNNGLSAQVANGKTDLMDILPVEKLTEPVDDLGLTLIFLAIYYDRPEIIEYLHKRGVDVTKPCDPMEYGNPMFYAIQLRRIRLMLTLDLLGCTVRAPCDSLKTLPLTHAKRLDDENVNIMLKYCFGKEQRAGTLVKKHFMRIKYRKIYLKKLQAIPTLIRVMRGMIARARCRRLRKKKADNIRRAARRLRRQDKLENGDPLDSDDESSADELGVK